MNGPSKILIVDDEAAGRETLEGLLLAHGYELIFAESGIEALAKAKEHSPDLILLDVMLPGMDGYEVCRKLRETPDLSEAPILMVTALDDRNSRLKGIEAGADDFISKPFDRAELRARIKSITRLNRYRRLLAERAKFEWVIDQAEEAYLIVSPTDELLYANAAARVYLGLPNDVSIPLSGKFIEVAEKHYSREPDAAWKHWAASPSSIFPRYLVRAETPQAKGLWLQVVAVNCAVNSQVGRVIKLTNVSPKMKAQREMWSLHSAISHKMRTPLTGMLGSLEILSDEKSLTPKESAELKEVAWNSAKRLHAQIEDILQYLNSTGLAQTGKAFHLRNLRTLATSVSNSLGLEKVTLTVEEGLDNLQLTLSARAFELALWELLENAKKFHPQQSPAIEISAFLVNQEIALQIGDDGLNLPAEELTKVMIPYHQSEKRFTGEAEGMGLGLAMVASMLWDIGGRCTISNRQEGPGVVVDLRLPVQVAQQNEMLETTVIG